MGNSTFRLEPTKQMVHEVRNELSPLLADLSPDHSAFILFLNHALKFKKRLEQSAKVLDILGEISDHLAKSKFASDGSQEKHASLLGAFCYLMFVESLGSLIVNLVLLLLVGRGYHLHLEPDYKHRYIRHAASLEDIESPILPLSVKLDYLKSNEFPFFSKWIDRKLRNKIAHLDYEIDDKGIFFILENGGTKEVNLDPKIVFFVQYFWAVSKVLDETLFKKES